MGLAKTACSWGLLSISDGFGRLEHCGFDGRLHARELRSNRGWDLEVILREATKSAELRSEV